MKTGTSPQLSRRGERQNARGEATRQLILLTAERLFAERGISAVPLRDIGIAAGQRNNVAVQYHFGDREALIQEVARFRAGFIDDICRDLLARSSPPAVIDHVRSYVEPLAANLEDGNYYLPFLSHYYAERASYQGLMPVVNKKARKILSDVLEEILPDIPRPVLGERWQIVMTSTVHVLARHLVEMRNGTLKVPIQDLVEDLIQISAAGLAVPAPRDLAQI